MRFARVPTVSAQRPRPRLRRRQRVSPSSSASARPATSTARAPIREAYRRHRRGVRRLSARDSLRAQGQLDAGASLRLLRALGSRADANSGGEIAGGAARRLRARRDRLHRRRQDARRARAARSPAASARSTPNRRASSIASPPSRTAMGRVARVALRVNPDIDAKSHPNISTGLQDQQVRRAAARTRARSTASVATRPACASSACTSTSARRSPRPSRCAAPPTRWSSLALELRDDGVAARARRSRRRSRHRLRGTADDHRGGVRRGRAAGAAPRRHSGRPRTGPRDRRRTPARSSSRVVDTKQYPDGRRFAVLDAGMTELMRPALYGSFHRIVPVRAAARRPSAVGRRRPDLREQRRVRARPRSCRDCEVDDLVAVLDTGAYGAVMASNYNRRLLRAGGARGRRRVAHHPPPADARRRAGARGIGVTCADCSSPSKGSTRAASRRRPSGCAIGSWPPAGRCGCCRFPTTTRRSAPRSGGRCAASASYGADVMQLLYVANRYEWKPQIERERATRHDPHLRSLPGVERRLRRGAGARPARGCTRSRSTCRSRTSPCLLDIAPEVSARAQDRRTATVRARPRPAGARARQLPAPGRGWRLGDHRGERRSRQHRRADLGGCRISTQGGRRQPIDRRRGNVVRRAGTFVSYGLSRISAAPAAPAEAAAHGRP